MRWAALAVGATVVVLAVPFADAQTGSDGRWLGPKGSMELEPETGTLEVPLTFEYQCDESLAVPHVVKAEFFVVSAPGYTTAVLNPQTKSITAGFQSECSQPEEYVAFNVTLILVATRDAPAYRPFQVEVAAKVEYGPEQSREKDGPFVHTMEVEATFFPLLDARADRTVLKMRPNGQADFSMDVTNYSNGPTRVTANVTATTSHRLAAIVPPAPFVLESRQFHGSDAQTEQTTSIRIVAPDAGVYENRIYSFAVTLTGSHAADRSEANHSRTLQLSVQVQGTGAASPGPTLLPTIVLLGGAVLALRRRAQ